MNKLVHSVPLRELNTHYRDALEILQLGFHLFAEDFIHHILDEERKVFDYLVSLEYASYDKNHLHASFFRIKKTSLCEMGKEHADDDEMKSIREMTENYRLTDDMPLEIKVLYEEFRRFDTDLQRHAEIENDFLFPKGEKLEKEIILAMQKIAVLN
jgi:regulator of cell morphogenesis and NO signaling